MKTITVKIGNKKQQVFGTFGRDMILVPRVENGACMLRENGYPVLRWVRSQKPFKLSWLTRLEYGLLEIEIIDVAAVSFILFTVSTIIYKVLS